MNKKLAVSKTDKCFLGVCGGLADYFGMDVGKIRFLFIICSLLGGSGLVAYLILAIMMRD